MPRFLPRAWAVAAKAEADVLHAVVCVHLRCPLHADRQVETAVAGEERQHVVESRRRYAPRRGRNRRAQGYFTGESPRSRGSLHCVSFSLSSVSVSRPWPRAAPSICSGVPIVMRTQSESAPPEVADEDAVLPGDSLYSRAPIRQGRARTEVRAPNPSARSRAPRAPQSGGGARRLCGGSLAAQQAQSRMAAAPAHRAVRFTL